MPAEVPAQTGFISSPPGDSAPYLEAWQEVLHLGTGLDDARLIAEFGCLSGLTADRIPVDQTLRVEAYADVRVQGEIEERRIRVLEPTLEHIRDQWFRSSMELLTDGALEVVKIRIRRFSKTHD